MRDSDIAYEKIKEMIITTKLMPGEVIVDSELMDELGMGRTPIREALNRLSWEKQVRIIPRQCIMTSELPIRELESICQLRYTLEILEGELVALNRTDEDIEKLNTIIDEMQKETIPENRVLLDREFHKEISAITKNEFLAKEMNVTMDLCVRLLFLNKKHIASMNDTVINEYREIVNSIKEKDVKKTIKLLQDHVTSFKNKFII